MEGETGKSMCPPASTAWTHLYVYGTSDPLSPVIPPSFLPLLPMGLGTESGCPVVQEEASQQLTDPAGRHVKNQGAETADSAPFLPSRCCP